jgi:hypothetical protein
MSVGIQYEYFFPDGVPSPILVRAHGSSEDDVQFAAREHFDGVDESRLSVFPLPNEFNDMIKEVNRSIQDMRFENIQVNHKYQALTAIHAHATALTKSLAGHVNADIAENFSEADSSAISTLREEAVQTYNGLIKSFEFLTFNSFYAKDLLSSLHDAFENSDIDWRRKVWDELQAILSVTAISVGHANSV